MTCKVQDQRPKRVGVGMELYTDCGQDSKSFGDDTSTVKDDVTVMC